MKNFIVFLIHIHLVLGYDLSNLPTEMQQAYDDALATNNEQGLMFKIHGKVWDCYIEMCVRIYEWRPLNITAYPVESQQAMDTVFNEINTIVYPVVMRHLKEAVSIKNNVKHAVEHTHQACDDLLERGEIHLQNYKLSLKRQGMVVEWHDRKYNYVWRTKVTESPFATRNLFGIRFDGDLHPETCGKDDERSKTANKGKSRLLHALAASVKNMKPTEGSNKHR